ncbi:hypothetical protein [Leptospira alexanderi]|uniref:Uncharacterized protein n=1 Tax=Leptospira alexanderi serovar Manhao 3 str. L 60 TaxID=1049759 RepID=V6IET9_9LEPT|nr:hypothetical protein [Leptospira alexanderi]EQA62958.1 hypothetical protein LEP1GSC062_1113 [Leptospira alexanderi serovar Manhao 3 str. L 60]
MTEIVKRNIPVFPYDSGYAIGKDGYLLSDFGNCLNLFLEYSIEKSDGCSLKGTLNFV